MGLLLTVATTIGLNAEAADDLYLADLLRRAAEARLSEERDWHALLHYRRNLISGYTSEADDPGFFLAPTGKTDPRAELEATLAKLFSDELVGRSRQPAQCAFIGRYHWLKEKLSFDEDRLRPQSCERFVAWFNELNPQSVTLIFPSAFMNNPASMFGHTLIRIDQKRQTEETRILAYTINYAADVPPDAGVAYPILGVIGGYKGYFSTIPYYLKVQEYGDIENRDIWEYPLTLTDAQIRRMLMHAWELGNAYFDYYFFKENCAYHILSLIEVANPAWHVTDRFHVWTIPTDTIRALAEQPKLLGEVVYRPSRINQIRARFAELSGEERTWFSQITSAPSLASSPNFAVLAPMRRAAVLDTVSDYLRYRSVKDPDHVELHRTHLREVLTARSELRVRSEPLRPRSKEAPPEQGHKTARAGLGIGWRQADRAKGSLFEEVNLRAGYHDLLDPDQGYTRDAQIELLSLSLRHYERGDQVRLERFTLANIVSLSPMDALFKAPSWKLNVGMQTIGGRSDAGCTLCSMTFINGGIGAAFESHLLHREVYFGFAELEADHGGTFEERHRAGGGGTVGFLAELTDRWKILASTSYLRFPLGDRSDEVRLSLGQRYTLRQNLAVRLELNRRDRDNEALFTVHAYF
jgi:hypothetical protein